MKTARNITLVSLLAAGVIAVPVAYAKNNVRNNVENWLDHTAVKATLTFTEPNQHGFDFASVQTAPANKGYVDFVGVKQEFDYALGLEHKLSNGVSRLFVDYDHFEAEQSSGFSGVQENLLGAGAATASGNYEIRSDAVKLGSRHRLNFGSAYSVDLGAALSWIDVDRDFLATQTAAGVSRSLLQEANFRAFGPFFDVATKYHMNAKNKKGLNVQAYAGAGLLYAKSNFTSSLLTGGAAGAETFDREGVKGLSSEMAIKLAIGWDHVLCNKTVFSASLGYMMMHYSDAFNYGATGGAYARFAQGAAVAANPGAGAGNSSAGFPFTRQGPFLEFKWSGAKA